jgi:hypothetical protein
MPTRVSGDLPDRLSVSTPRRLPPRALTAEEMATLRRIADTLIPPGDGLTSGGSVAEFEALATRAAAILDKSFDALTAVLETLANVPQDALWETLKSLSEKGDVGFNTVSMLLVGVYLYSDEGKAQVDYPPPHPNPPGLFDAADELSSGILDPVMSGGFTYVAAD